MLKLKNKLLVSLIIIFSFLITVSNGAVYASLDTFLVDESDGSTKDLSLTEEEDSLLRLEKMVDYKSKESGLTYVHYDLNGGANNIGNLSYIEKGRILQLRAPHRFGYLFKGWYVDPYFTTEVKTIPYTPDEGFMVYAKWERKINNVYNVENYQYDSVQSSKVKLLKNCDYSFVEDINIPGMPATREEDFLNQYIFSESQCPQGICITDEYVLITSYSEGKEVLGELMVFDRSDGEYLVTLGMDAESHLGGIAFDGSNVWVCNSNDGTIERISYDFICLMATANSKKVVDATEVVDIYEVSNTPSCITWYGGRLWVATHDAYFNSKMIAYYYDEKNDSLSRLSSYKIPPKVQGIAFNKTGRVYLSVSYGRNSSSYIKVYSSIISLSSNPGSPSVAVEMPPGSEEIDFVDDNLYVLFESAGEKYLEGTDGKGFCVSPIDKILELNTDSL